MSDSQLISLPSRFDYAYHKPFYDVCTEHLNKDGIKEIILDFTHVEYMDSSALGMLVMIHKKTINVMKKIKIKNARGATEEILKMANIQKLIEFI
jgi:HptB-dependent secretion and biofilm anti anti-sigma factor